jgi:putative flippase GtrA
VDGQEVSVSVPGVAGILGLVSPSSPVSKAISTPLKFGHALAKYVVFFLLGLLILAVAPARLDRVTASLSRSPVRDVLVGLLGTVAMPVLTVLLVVTVVGILLIPVQAIAILVAAILGYTALALLVGRALPFRPERGTAVVQLAIGTALVVAISEIPFVGIMAMISAWFLVFGAVLRSRGGQATPAQPGSANTIVPTTGV